MCAAIGCDGTITPSALARARRDVRTGLANKVAARKAWVSGKQAASEYQREALVRAYLEARKWWEHWVRLAKRAFEHRVVKGASVSEAARVRAYASGRWLESDAGGKS